MITYIQFSYLKVVTILSKSFFCLHEIVSNWGKKTFELCIGFIFKFWTLFHKQCKEDFSFFENGNDT